MNGAELLVKCLEAHSVEYIFGIPGAKIDSVFNALLDSKIKLIVCRHEQNAAFMAAAYGRLTGKPGVVLVTSGPGVSNLATGLLTATTEGDPIVALAGNVPRNMLLKESHQSLPNAKLLEVTTKSSIEITAPENIPEVIADAFRISMAPRSGACFISFPQDILTSKTKAPIVASSLQIEYGPAEDDVIKEAAKLINHAKFPILLVGEEASRLENTKAIRSLLKKTKLPTIGTFQAAGVVSRELVECFAGRVGLFQNQPGDKLINEADLVITVGFNTVEYDPEVWNANQKKEIIHIDYTPAKIHICYQPKLELLGDIHANLHLLEKLLDENKSKSNLDHVAKYNKELLQSIQCQKKEEKLIHPLCFIQELREIIDDDTLVICDVGTVYMWMARYFLSYQPRHLLFSNGQQTLGVALPWAISAHFCHPKKKIVSISGDGGFLFSAMELETAVREKCHFVHCVWRDGTYNMVLEQEVMKYGRKSGVDFGKVDLMHFAKAFGAEGRQINNHDEIQSIIKEGLNSDKPFLIDVPIDYSDNPKLFEVVNPNYGP